MFKLIKDSYKMYLKSFPLILLFAVPLLFLSGITVWIENSETVNRGMLYFHYFAFVLIPLVSVATDISLYRRFFGFSIINPLSSLKTFILYLLTQLALGLVASAPIILFRYVFETFGMPTLPSFVLAIVLDLFLGIYLLARFSILFPLIIQNKVPSLKDFSQYTARSYKDWMSVSLLIYMPYVIFNYVITCPFLNTLVVNLFAFVFVCFNIKYVETFRVPAAKAEAAKKTSVKINVPAPEKTEPVKISKPAARKTSASKTAAPKKGTAVRKTAAPKKAVSKTPVKNKP